MANEDVTSLFRDLQRSITTAQNDLQQSIRAARNDIAGQVDQVGNNVQSAVRLYKSLQSDLDSLREQVTSFIHEERLARNMQFAKTAIVDVRAERDRKFGQHEAVRRSTIGMLQAMDAGIVTESTLQQAAERRMIDAPRYWLAPAQVALAAWIRDSRAVAERALLEAMAREPNKTALFFSLVLARHERYEASAKWIYEYVNRQDSAALSREFVVVLDAANQGALGGRALSLLKERCISWYEQLNSAEEMSNNQRMRWRALMERQRRGLAEEFEVLPNICPDWSNTLQWLEGATVHGQNEQVLRKRFAAPIVHYDDLRHRVDSILRNLISAYDEDEAPLLRQEARWQAVIDAGGDHTTALLVSEDHTSEPEPQTDFLTLLANIGLQPRKAGASAATEQFAIALASEWIVDAAQELSASNRGEHPGSVPVNIHGWTRDLHPDDNYDAVAEDYTKFIDRQVREEVNRVTVSRPRAALAVALIVLISSVFALRLRSFPQTFSMTSVALAGLLLLSSSLWLLLANRSLPGRKENVRSRGEDRKEDGIYTVQVALNEVRKLFELWVTEISKEGSLVDFIRSEASHASQLPLLSVEATPSASAASGPSRPQQIPKDAATEGAAERPRLDTSAQSLALRLPSWELLPPTVAVL